MAGTGAAAGGGKAVGDEDEDREQDDEGDARHQPLPADALEGAELLRQERGGHADEQAAEVGPRQAGEAADGGGAERLDHEKAEQDGIEAQGRKDEDPGDNGERGADQPRDAADTGGAPACRIHEFGVVDDATHGGSEPSPLEQNGETDRAGRGHDDHDHLLDADPNAEEREGAGGQEGSDEPALGSVESRRQALDDEEPERGHDLQRGADPVQGGGEPLQRQAEDGGDHHHADQQGDRPGEPSLMVELVEGEGPDRGQRAMGEVEDARRPVGQHEAGGRQSVDGAGRQPHDDVRQVVAHGLHTAQGRRPAWRCAEVSDAWTALPATNGQSGRWYRVMVAPATGTAAGSRGETGILISDGSSRRRRSCNRLRCATRPAAFPAAATVSPTTPRTTDGSCSATRTSSRAASQAAMMSASPT